MSDQPAPLSEEEIARLREEHAHCASDVDDDYPHSLVCGSDDGACDVLRLLATLDQERTLRQAAAHARQQALSLAEQRAETITAYARQKVELRAALAQERQARETALTEAVRVLHRADSRLGLLLSRGNIQWGFGVGEQQDTSQVIGEIRRTIALLEETTHA